jgi:quercetin dioxygenase-like cupin family protein
MKNALTLAAAAAILILPGLALAHGVKEKHVKAASQAAQLEETIAVAADKLIPNAAGKRLVSLIVDYPPGASSKSHRHAGSAFIYAYVLSGAVLSAVDGEAPRLYQTGEAWFENPGAHHQVSANASKIAPARLLAIFIVDADESDALTTPTAD